MNYILIKPVSILQNLSILGIVQKLNTFFNDKIRFYVSIQDI